MNMKSKQTQPDQDQTKNLEELLENYNHILESDDRIREFHRSSWINEQRTKQFAALSAKMREQVKCGRAHIVVDESGYREPDETMIKSLKEFLEARIEDIERAIASGTP